MESLGRFFPQGHQQLSGKVMQKVIFTKPNSAFYQYYVGTLQIFSRPMRDKDTSALRKMFQ